jgi:hypothetical protein
MYGLAGRVTWPDYPHKYKENKMIDRIVGVFKLDAETFEEIEHDQSATTQAVMIVLAVSLIGALGGLIGGGGIKGFLNPIVSTLIGWLLWSGATYFVGTSLFGGQADLGEMLRVVGFAHAPMVLSIIPCFGWIIGLLWTLAALVVAIRQGLDVDTTQAAIVGVIGFVLVFILNIAVQLIFGVSNAIISGVFGG